MTRPTARHRNGKVALKTENHAVTLDGEDAIRLAHDLMKAGRTALKKAGKWKPH